MSHFYQYDDNHNILTIRDLVEPAKDVTLTYDGLDRLDTASGFWGNGSFSYDLLGNVKSKVLGNQSLTYAYNTKNRLAGVTGNINRSFDYDSRGNVISNGVRAFSFNLGNQLISSGSNSYQYDGYNRRIKKSSNGKIQYTFYDSTGQLLLTDGDNGLTEYFYLGNKLIAKESKVTTSEDSPGYTGHLEDDDLQLTYMQARYYDPVIGRFYSNDPVDAMSHLGRGSVQGFNRYNYAYNNPYKYTDPDGKVPILIPIVVFALKEGASEVVEQTTGVPMPTVKNAGKAIGKHVVKAMARGRASEKRILNKMGLDKNNSKVSTSEGNSVPDALTDTMSVEVKDVKNVSLTKQLRIQTQSAKAEGKTSVLVVTDKNEKISGPAKEAFDVIIKEKDLN